MNCMKKEIKALVFDFDNTLGNRYEAVYLTLREYLRLIKDMNPHSLQMETIVQDLCVWDEGGAGIKTEMLKRLREKYGIDATGADFRKFWDENLSRHMKCFPGVRELLEKLKDKYLLGCITNGSAATQTMKLRNSGIYDLFDRIMISGSEKSAKPDKKIFLEMAERLGVKPEECVFVGDAFSLDVQGALNAGFEAVWVCKNQYQPSGLDILKITDVTELDQYY